MARPPKYIPLGLLAIRSKNVTHYIITLSLHVSINQVCTQKYVAEQGAIGSHFERGVMAYVYTSAAIMTHYLGNI